MTGPTGHVITIDVDHGARRSGVGSLLLRAAEDRLRAEGSRAVGLETAVDNLAALAFYKRHGYNVIRTWPRYYSNGVDALVMRKELTLHLPAVARAAYLRGLCATPCICRTAVLQAALTCLLRITCSIQERRHESCHSGRTRFIQSRSGGADAAAV